MAKTNINDLPPEILLWIFSYLEPLDVTKAAATCNLWNDLSNTNLLWVQIYRRHARKWSVMHGPSISTSKQPKMDTFFLSYLNSYFGLKEGKIVPPSSWSKFEPFSKMIKGASTSLSRIWSKLVPQMSELWENASAGVASSISDFDGGEEGLAMAWRYLCIQRQLAEDALSEEKIIVAKRKDTGESEKNDRLLTKILKPIGLKTDPEPKMLLVLGQNSVGRKVTLSCMQENYDGRFYCAGYCRGKTELGGMGAGIHMKVDGADLNVISLHKVDILEEQSRPAWHNLFKNASLLCYVVDAESNNDDITRDRQMMATVLGSDVLGVGPNTPLIVFALNQDRTGRQPRSVTDIATELRIGELCASGSVERAWICAEASTAGIRLGIKWAVSQL